MCEAAPGGGTAGEDSFAQLLGIHGVSGEHIGLRLTDVLEDCGVGHDGDGLAKCSQFGMGDQHRGWFAVAGDFT